MKMRRIFFLAFVAMATALSAQENRTASELADSSRIFVIDEINAAFPGGNRACMKWIQEHIKYPEGCCTKMPQGRVNVSFIVERDGSIDSIKVIKSPDAALSEEAVRLVSEMPKWSPARYYGKTVRSRIILPVIFKRP